MTAEAKPTRTGIVPNIISGLATGLFSIPEGMAYAQLAGVKPGVLDVLKKGGALEAIGEQNVFPATARVLAGDNAGWQAAQKWLEQQKAAVQPDNKTSKV